MIQNQFLSPHFQLKEFTESATARKLGIANVPPPEAVENLRTLCVNTLEPLRETLGLPIIITSGYRCKALNDKLSHSSERSQHMLGQATDFYISPEPASSKFQVSSSNACDKFQDSCAGNQHLDHETGESPMKHETGSRRELLIKAFHQIILNDSIDYDQLILYPSFIHVSYVSRERNRRTILLGMHNGKLGYGKCSIQNALKIQ